MNGQQGNPFYVAPMLARGMSDPVGSFQRGQQGAQRQALFSQQQEMLRQQQEQQQQDAADKAALASAPDMKTKYEILSRNPRLLEEYREQTEFFNDESKRLHLNSAQQMLNAKSMDDAISIMQQKIRTMQQIPGVDTSHSERQLQRMLDGNMTMDDIYAEQKVELLAHPEGQKYLETQQSISKPMSEAGRIAYDMMNLPEGSDLRPRFLAMLEKQANQAGGEPTAAIKNYEQWVKLNKDELQAMPPGEAKQAMAQAFEEFARPSQLVATGGGGYGFASRIGGGLNPVVNSGDAITAEATKKNILQQSKDSAAAIPAIVEKAGNIRQMIGRYGQALNAIEQGAGTGPLERLLPTVTAATTVLENLQAEIGLDIIASGKFGQLTEKELDTAFRTGLPVGLDEPALRQWITDKQQAQQAVLNELERYVEFLGAGGTQAQWMASSQSGAPAGGSYNPKKVGRFEVVTPK